MDGGYGIIEDDKSEDDLEFEVQSILPPPSHDWKAPADSQVSNDNLTSAHFNNNEKSPNKTIE